MNKKQKQIQERIQIHKDYDTDELSQTELQAILETYKELGYKFTFFRQTIDDLKDTLETLIRCETLTYRELQSTLRYYKEKGIITYYFPIKTVHLYLQYILNRIFMKFEAL